MRRKVYEDELYRLQTELVKMQEWVRESGARVAVLGFTYQEHPRVWREAGRAVTIVERMEDLAAAEIEIAQMENYLGKLHAVLEPVRSSGRFRVILIDCPPALGMLSMNSLAAADFLLITLQCEYMAMEGLGQILRNVERLKAARVNDRLELGGVVMTMFDARTNLARQVVEEFMAGCRETIDRLGRLVR